ncbi:MAG TPA: hypothetical protein VE863_04900 [Pyrinomonadaceae bacterium]|jgi:plastocyanin|nr:hypothetical protein [Pyrinomonadaceae bacterium]
MADWSIKIVPAPENEVCNGEGAAFQPNIAGYDVGDPLPAQQADSVSWSNQTDDEHQPWPTDANYNPLSEAVVLPRGSANYLSDPIPAGEPSTPAYWCAQAGTVYYFCRLHPNMKCERGSIDVSDQPTS